MSDERAFVTVRDRRLRPPLRMRVRKKLDVHWCWIKCTRWPPMRGRDCALHHPVGTDGWQDMLRRAARCTKCGKRGVELQHPSWGGSDTGWTPMPISQMAPVPESAVRCRVSPP